MKVKRICGKCNKEFLAKDCPSRIGRGMFCSRHCARSSHVLLSETKEKIKAFMLVHPNRGQFKKGIGPWNKGKTGIYSEATIMSMKLSAKSRPTPSEKTRKIWSSKRIGNKNPNWRDGLSQKKYVLFTRSLKLKIRERDNFTCQKCCKTEKNLGYTLSVNHIDFNKQNYSENNLNALCKSCNSVINFSRDYWTNVFQQKIKQIYV